MLRRTVFGLIGASGLLVAALLTRGAEPAPAQPVFILLYSRFYDHSHPRALDERIQRLLPLLDRLHNKYPALGASALLQFSGTTSQIMEERNSDTHLVDKIKEYQSRGLVDVGYTGEDEPSYLYRPKADVLLAETPADRWQARTEAAEHFLIDFKDPVTGRPAGILHGGLQRMQEVFGTAAFISGANPARFSMGGDSPVSHAVAKLNQTALLEGISANDSRRGIEGFGRSAPVFSEQMSPDATESPELFWQDGDLRLSASSLRDNKPHSTDEDPQALKKIFQALNRSHVRVVKLEVAPYLRYLKKRADGSLVNDPMEWLYYHPDDPSYPMTIKAMTEQNVIETGYRNEEKFLEWLAGEFLPANPGSRFISARELVRMGAPANGDQVSLEQLKALATDIDMRFARTPMAAPNYAQAGGEYFSIAESFQLLAQALAVADKTGSLPNQVKLTRMYGPLEIPENNMGLTVASFTVADVMHRAAQLAPQLADAAWKVVPNNAVPATLELSGKSVNAAQFLRLMAQACLDPAPAKTLKINAVQMFSASTFMYPKNTIMGMQGMGWTFKPAPLHLDTLGHSAAGQ